MKQLDPVNRKLFIDFLRKSHPDAYYTLTKRTYGWHSFKDYYAYLLGRYWHEFNKWLKNLGFKTAKEKLEGE